MAATHKNVNGVRIPLTPDEVTAIEADWAAADAAKAIEDAKPAPTQAEKFDKLAAASGLTPTDLIDELKKRIA